MELLVVERSLLVSWRLAEDNPGTLDMDVVVQVVQAVLVVRAAVVDVAVVAQVLVVLHL